jgi:hypothetical protein
MQLLVEAGAIHPWPSVERVSRWIVQVGAGGKRANGERQRRLLVWSESSGARVVLEARHARAIQASPNVRIESLMS